MAVINSKPGYIDNGNGKKNIQ